MSKVIREGFAQFSKRQQEGVSLVTDAINQEDSEQKVYSEWLEKRQDRKRKLLYQDGVHLQVRRDARFWRELRFGVLPPLQAGDPQHQESFPLEVLPHRYGCLYCRSHKVRREFLGQVEDCERKISGKP